jgi:hypothetical protein
MIPMDVQHVLGRKVFLLPLGVPATEPEKAYAKSIPIVREWQRRIEQARRTCQDPEEAKADRFVRDYARYRRLSLTSTNRAMLRDVYDYFYRKAKLITDEQYERIVAARDKKRKRRRRDPC